MMSRARRPLLLVLLLAVVLAACRDQTPPPPAVGEAAVLTCTDECVARGQCGRLATNQPVVLANEGGPSVRFQDHFYADGTRVTVVDINERQLIAATDGAPVELTTATPFPHSFFRVDDGAGKVAWVSSWCVARPPN